MKHLACSFGLLGLLLSTSAFAQSTPSENDAKDLYSKRGSDHMNAKKSADMYAQLAGSAQTDQDFARFKIGEADSLYYYGVNLDKKKDKLAVLEKGQDAALAAAKKLEKKLGEPKNNNDSSLLAEAYYAYGAAKAKWGSVKGLLSAAGQWKGLTEYLEAGKSLDPAPGDYGFNRILGIGHHRVPGFFGGEGDKALPNLEDAYNGTLVTTANGLETSSRVGTTLYYLEVLADEKDVDTFCEVYEGFLDYQSSMDTIYPEKYPENKMDLDEYNNDPSSEHEDIQEYADDEC